MKRLTRLGIGVALGATVLVSSLFNVTASQSVEKTVSNPSPTIAVERVRTEVQIVHIERKVVSGETLNSISNSVFASNDFAELIYDQNSKTIEYAASEFGWPTSDFGHWIFPGEKLTISFPVTNTVAYTESETVAVTTITETVTLTNTPTQTVPTTMALAETGTAVVTATPTLTATETVKTIATATFSATVTATPSKTTTVIPTATSTAAVVVSPTSAPFVFSPSWPIVGIEGIHFYISTQFGEVTKESPRGHRGIDIADREKVGGFPIQAIESGEVSKSGFDKGYGYFVELTHPDGRKSVYGHFDREPTVQTGELVAKGQVIGFMGSTGFSTGNHLHLELTASDGQLVNPLDYLDQNQMNKVPLPPTPEPVVKTATAQAPVVQRSLSFGNEFSRIFQEMRLRRDSMIWTRMVNYVRWMEVVQEKKERDNFAVAVFFLHPWSVLPKGVDKPRVAVQVIPQSEVEVQDYSLGYGGYEKFLTEMANLYDVDLSSLLGNMKCENEAWNPRLDYIDSDGTQTAGIASMKQGTYQSAAQRMGLDQSQIDSWTDPFNQLRVMAWKFAVGEGDAWSGYYNLVHIGKCRP